MQVPNLRAPRSLSIVIPEQSSFKVDIPALVDILKGHSNSPTKVGRSSSASTSRIYNETNEEDDKRCCNTPINPQTILISRYVDGFDQLVPKRFFDGWCGRRSLYQRAWNIFYNTIACALQEKLKKYPLLGAEVTLMSFAAIRCDIFTKYEQGLPLLLGDSADMKKRIEEETTPEFIVTLRRVVEYIHKIAEPSVERVEKQDDEKVSAVEIDKVIQKRRKNSLSSSFHEKVLINIEKPEIELISRGFKNLYSKGELCSFEEIMAHKATERLSFQNVLKIFQIVRALFEKAKKKCDETKIWEECLDQALQEWPFPENTSDSKSSSSFMGTVYNAVFGTSGV